MKEKSSLERSKDGIQWRDLGKQVGKMEKIKPVGMTLVCRQSSKIRNEVLFVEY